VCVCVCVCVCHKLPFSAQTAACSSPPKANHPTPANQPQPASRPHPPADPTHLCTHVRLHRPRLSRALCHRPHTQEVLPHARPVQVDALKHHAPLLLIGGEHAALGDRLVGLLGVLGLVWGWGWGVGVGLGLGCWGWFGGWDWGRGSGARLGGVGQVRMQPWMDRRRSSSRLAAPST